MGLFGKHKDNKEVKKVEAQEETTFVELGEPISNQIIRDVQKHLHLGAKQERPTLPLFISVSRIPNPENFVDFDTLLAEVNQEDEEDRLAREAKEKKEAEAKALKEKQEQEQLEASKQKQEAEEIPQEEVLDEIELEELEDQVEEDNSIVEPETEVQSTETPVESETNTEEVAPECEETPTLDNIEASKEELEENVDENKEESTSDTQEEVESPIDNENVATEQTNNTQEETISQDIEQKESNEQENIENNTQDTSQEQERLAKEAAEKQEQERLAKEEAEKQEQERLAKEKEEEEKKKAELAKKKGPTITSISAANLKGAKRGVVKASAVKKGGVSAAKEASDAIKEKEEEKKKKAAQARIEAKRASEKEAEIARLATVSIIGTDKKPKPENGKFEIQWSNDNVKPYKLVLKNDQGKVLYESTPIKTKPNELTATTFRNILSTGSFVFISTPVGYAFKILDSRMRVFHVSKAYRNAIDAQKLAAQIKKFGLSANYIDDLTKA